MAWCGTIAPKKVLPVLRLVRCVPTFAAARFNHEALTLVAVLREMGCIAGDFTEMQLRLEDSQRTEKAKNRLLKSRKREERLSGRERKDLKMKQLSWMALLTSLVPFSFIE